MALLIPIILTILLIFIIYRITLKIKPEIFMNKDSNISKIISQMKTLKYYKPTPWLIGGDMHTMWGMAFKGKKIYKAKREDIDFEDGGQVTIEHFVLDKTPNEAPILFIVHTMGGGSREPCTGWAAYNFMNKGYRVIVCSCRGCNGSKLKTKRMCDSSNYQDTHVIIDYISKKYPSASKKFLLGFSMGAIISLNYTNEYDDIDGVVSVSHVIDNKKSDIRLCESFRYNLYAKPLFLSLIRSIKKCNLYTDEEIKAIFKIKRGAEYHNLVSAKNMGLKNADEYYELTKLYGKPSKVKVPTLIINSEDDPLTLRDYIDAKELTDKSNNNLALVLTKEGGHVSFCEGLNGMGSYVEDVAEEFFNILMKK